MGGRLRPRLDQRVCDSNRPRAKNCSALQAKLSPNEKARLDQRPTENSDAYLLFVQAHDYATRRDMFHDTSLKAIPLFEQAIKLDPKFALAFAGLSMAESWLYLSRNRTRSREKRASMPTNPCACNRISRRVISHSFSRIIMATAITSELSPNSKLPGAVCPMTSSLFRHQRNPATTGQVGGVHGEFGKSRRLGSKKYRDPEQSCFQLHSAAQLRSRRQNR